MHILDLHAPAQMSRKEALLPGQYLVEDLNGAQLMVLASGGSMQPIPLSWSDQRKFDATKDWNGKYIAVQRIGGFGDLILLSPVLREIKRRWPKCVLHVVAMKYYGVVSLNLPFVDDVVSYPMATAKALGYDAWIFLENAAERNPLAQETHMTDLFGKIAGIDEIEDKRPALELTTNEKIWVMEAYPRIDGQRRICVQPVSSAKARNYPVELMSKVLQSLQDKGWEIFLMGAKGDIGEVQARDGLRDLTTAGLTFRQSCAVINNADCVLAPDSSLLHVAGALGIPAVGLYGPFPSDLRTRYCPSTITIDGHGPCAPCFHHKGRMDDFPANAPCSKTGRCEILAGIKPEAVVNKIIKVAKKFELAVV